MKRIDPASVVTFTNISDEDFQHAFAGLPYTIKARESMVMPEILARHLAKHLSRRMLNSKTVNTVRADDRFQAAYSNRSESQMVALIISDRVHKPEPPVLNEGARMAARVETLNDLKEEIAKEEGEEAPEKVTEYADKAEVIAALESKDIAHDKRKSKETLEQLLAE